MTSIVRKTSLCEQVAAQLRTQILTSYRPGDRLPVTAELVKTLGVSWNTVRHGLDLLARQGLVHARQGRGTFVCERPPRCVAILIEQDILHPSASFFFTQIPRVLQRFFNDNKIRTRLYIGTVQAGESVAEPTCWSFVEDLKDRRFDAVAVVGTPALPGVQELAKAQGLPIVGSGVGYPNGFDDPCSAMVRDGLRWLREKGCHRAAVLSYGCDATQIATEMAALGLEGRPGWLQAEWPPQYTGAGWEEFRQIWLAYPDRPDGLLITDDVLFKEAQLAILELGIPVPERLKIVTHANAGSPIRSLFPAGLLEVNPEEVALKMGETLLRLMNGESVAERSIPVVFRRVEAAGRKAVGARVQGLTVGYEPAEASLASAEAKIVGRRNSSEVAP